MTTRSSMSDTDHRIRNRLALLKESFEPSILQNRGDSLDSFRRSFDELLTDCTNSKNEETHRMVRAFVDIVTTISSAILEIDAASKTIIQKLEVDIARLADVEFKKLSIHDRPEPAKAPYIEPCYTWLLAHLHNPYPSKNVRRQFAEQSSALEKDIDAWFIEARKHIGWNEIRRAYFETRFDMVKAATRHFKPSSRRTKGSADSLSFSDDKEAIDYSYHFATMENSARNWYSHKFFPTSLATNIGHSIKQSRSQQDAALSYPSPRRTPSCGADEFAPSTSVAERRKRRRDSDADLGSTFSEESPRPDRPLKRSRFSTPSTTSPSNIPSPAPSELREHSFSMSPSVAPSPLEEEELTVAVTHHEKRKRRQSDASDYDSDCSRAPRARTRRRVAEDDGELKIQRKISTPKRMLQMPDISRERPLFHAGASPQLPGVHTPSVSQALKRKRRLSDAQDQRPRKLPHHVALSIPRLQTVSNPFPIPSPFSDLEDIPTTLPAELPPFPESVNLIDTQNLDVESFDYSSMPILKDYLSQLESPFNNIDNSNTLSEDSFVIPETIPSSQLQGSISGTGSLPFLDLGLHFATTNQLSLSSYDELFSDIQSAAHTTTPEVTQNFSSTANSKISGTFNRSFNPIFNHDASALLTQPSSINPFDLMLYPSVHISPAHTVNPVVVADPSNMSWGPAVGDASQAALAIQKIQTLQAELEMCKNQLAQHGMFSF